MVHRRAGWVSWRVAAAIEPCILAVRSAMVFSMDNAATAAGIAAMLKPLRRWDAVPSSLTFRDQRTPECQGWVGRKNRRRPS